MHLQNTSGGVFGGDQLHLNVKLDTGAQVQITAVGATRLYRPRTGSPPARQQCDIQIGENALLEYLPEPVIPFALSSFEQTCSIQLSPGAGLIWWETICAGRIASGEVFAFEGLSAKASIFASGHPIALEHYAWRPQAQATATPARMGRFLYSTTMYVCLADEDDSRWLPLENQLGELAEELSSEEVRWGASTLVRHGVVIRGMAATAQQISRGLLHFWQTAKQEVWGRAATPPRKTL